MKNLLKMIAGKSGNQISQRKGIYFLHLRLAVILELLFRLSSGAAALFLLRLLEGNKLYMKEERNLLKTDVGGAEMFGSSYSALSQSPSRSRKSYP